MSFSKEAGFRKYVVDPKSYKIIQKINSGGFGCVYEVQNINTGQKTAAKVIYTQSNESQHKTMINREIGIMIRCKHPTIVKFVGYSFKDLFDQKNVTVFMEFAEKGTLADALEKVKKGLADDNYNNTTRQIILVGIARGMMYLHQQQIMHRDLKPENILLDKYLHPHITDFGLSKFTETDSSYSKSQQCGTTVYMAPEIMDEKRFTGKADVYSFGILMYEVLTDSIPYPLFQKGKISTLQFFNKVVNQNYRPKFDLPIKKSLKKLIERCWSKNPKERPTFEELFKKLAFNVEDSIYDIFDDQKNEEEDEGEIEGENDGNKYYLNDVDTDVLFSYIDYINSPSVEDSENSVDIEKVVEPLKKENEELKKQLSGLKKENDEFKKTISSIQKENSSLKKKVTAFEKENDEIKNRLSNLEKRFESLNPPKDDSDEKISSDAISIRPKRSIRSIRPNRKTSPDDDKNITVDSFNSMNSKEQQAVISKMYKNQLLKKVDDFLQFVLKFKEASEKTCVNIDSENKSKNLSDVNDKDQILVLHDAIEIIHSNQPLKSNEFVSLLKRIDAISVCVKYPSDSYQPILDIKQKSVPNMKIGLFITGIKKIGNELMNYKNIYFIKIDSSVSEIDDSGNGITKGSFSGCTSLTKVELPSSLKKLGKNFFYECTSLKQVNIPTSISSIEYQMFCKCSSLVQIKIPSTIIKIEPLAFFGCSSIKEIEIPSSVTKIGHQAFDGCSSLTKIKIPSSIKIIDEWTFRNCTSLTNVEIPSSVYEIKSKAFGECSSLKQIKIPSSVKTIADDAFPESTKKIFLK